MARLLLSLSDADATLSVFARVVAKYRHRMLE